VPRAAGTSSGHSSRISFANVAVSSSAAQSFAKRARSGGILGASLFEHVKLGLVGVRPPGGSR
jgi:hypothetical protein